MKGQRFVYILFGILYSIGLGLWLKTNYIQNIWFWLFLSAIGIYIAGLPYQSLGFWSELTTLLLGQLIFYYLGLKNPIFLFLPVITVLFICVFHKVFSKVSPFAVWISTAVWFFGANNIPLRSLSLIYYILLGATVLIPLVYTINSLGTAVKKTFKKIDVILASYTGNTAHYTGAFIAGMKESAAEVEIHRFHFYKEFRPNLTGDALVVAFPIFGCKPPWPLLQYLTYRLPYGRRKPAFIIYTSVGGSENSGFLAWLLLTLKGYRVMGLKMAVYPINVPVLRPGPAKLWDHIDAWMTPDLKTMQVQVKDGREFARGLRVGNPVIFYPSPVFLIGALVENNLFNMIYRNRVIRKRCNQCGLCVRNCPEQRLAMVNGYPKCKGSCSLCMSCVNLCPTRAMQIALSELGNPYHPKWRELAVVKK